MAHSVTYGTPLLCVPTATDPTHPSLYNCMDLVAKQLNIVVVYDSEKHFHYTLTEYH